MVKNLSPIFEGGGVAQGEIIIADDDAADRIAVAQALSSAGYEVRATAAAATLWR